MAWVLLPPEQGGVASRTNAGITQGFQQIASEPELDILIRYTLY